MALKIRFRRQGRKHLPFYRIVVMDTRAPRDGKYVEMLGWYNPVAKKEDDTYSVKADRVKHWLETGAELTEKMELFLERAVPEVMKWKKEKVLAKREAQRVKNKARRQRTVAA